MGLYQRDSDVGYVRERLTLRIAVSCLYFIQAVAIIAVASMCFTGAYGPVDSRETDFFAPFLRS